MRKLLVGLALIAALVPARAALAQPGERLIAEHGRSDYIIRLCKSPTLTEEYAARELQRYLAEISGANLFMREGTYLASIPEKTICVGVDDQVKELAPDIDWDKLGREEMVIRTVGEKLILAGGRPRGSLYSVYSFLDQDLGCRWFTPDCSKIPKQPRLVLKDIRRAGAPRLEYRCGFYSNMWQDRAWAVRNYDNGATAGDNIGGQLMMWGFVHSAMGLVPPGKYWKDHPEYYAYNEGSKARGASQLCLTHPEVLRIAIDSVREALRKDPATPFVTVSQEDNFGYCQCPNCKAIDEEEESHSGTLIRFVNKVAEVIEKDYPNTTVGTLAYQYTRKPPKLVKPRANVAVQLCSIECCFAHPLETCTNNASFRADIIGWSRICKRLFIWDYPTNFWAWLMPFPNFNSLESNVKFFAAHGVTGIFEQAEYMMTGAEMLELRSYLHHRLLWNPDYGMKRAMDEFMEASYGPVAPPIREYLRIYNEKVRKENIHFGCYNGFGAPFLSPDMTAKGLELMDKAVRLAGNDPVLLKRAKTAQMSLDYIAVSCGDKWATEAIQKGKRIGPFGPGWDAVYKKYEDRLTNHLVAINAFTLAEPGPSVPQYIEQLQKKKAPEVRVLAERDAKSPGAARLKIINDLFVPATVTAVIPANAERKATPESLRITVGAKAEKFLILKIDDPRKVKPEEAAPLFVEWSYAYQPTGGTARVQRPEKVAIPRD